MATRFFTRDEDGNLIPDGNGGSSPSTPGGGSYLSSALPDAAARVGGTIWVSDIAKAAFSNGTEWKQIALGATIEPSAGVTPDSLSGLLFYLQRNGGSGTTWLDSEGSDHGTLTGAAAWDTDGVNFTGGYVTGVGTNFPLGTSARTLLIRATADSLSGGGHALLRYGNTTDNQHMDLWVTDTSIKVEGYNDDMERTATLTTGVQMDVALTYDGAGTAKMYLNGVQLGADGSQSWNTVGATWRVGTDHGGRNWDGHIFAVAVFDRALTDTEIADLYDTPGW